MWNKSLPSTMGAKDSSSVQAVMIGKLVDAVMRNIVKAGPEMIPACYGRKSIEQRLGIMFPVFRIHDHPPYTLMIEQAIAKLNEEGGSSEESISKCITLEYKGLPWAHASFLSHHLKKHRDREEIIYTNDKRYMLRFDGSDSILPIASKEKFERGCGRKQGMHEQNKRSKRERSLEISNLEAEQKYGRRRTDMEVCREKNGTLCSSTANLDGDRAPQPERLINLPDTELATKESSHIKENGENALSQCPQHHGTEEADQVAEDLVHGNDEPMEDRVEVSNKQNTMEEPIPLEQELHVFDHAESDKQHDLQPDVMLSQQDQAETQPVSAEDAEQGLADSKIRSGIMKEPTGPRKSRPLGMFCQQILMRQKEIEELVEHLKQNMEANVNGVLPHEECLEFLRRNKAMELVFLEMLKASPESSTDIINHGPSEINAGGSFEAIFNRRWCQTNGILCRSLPGAAR